MCGQHILNKGRKREERLPNGVDTAIQGLDRRDLLSVLPVGFYIFTLANKRWFARMESNLGRFGE